MPEQALSMKPEQKKNNLRLGLILASVAIVFFLGFVGKMVLLGG
jgi:hypothetical protein